MLLLGMVLGITLGATALAALWTYQTYQTLRAYHVLVQAGDVRTIRPWMTLPYIARVYQVPEAYLDQWLAIQNSRATRHLMLQSLADQQHLPVGQLIHRVQQAILTYRQRHPHSDHVPLSSVRQWNCPCSSPSRGASPLCLQNGGRG